MHSPLLWSYTDQSHSIVFVYFIWMDGSQRRCTSHWIACRTSTMRFACFDFCAIFSVSLVFTSFQLGLHLILNRESRWIWDKLWIYVLRSSGYSYYSFFVLAWLGLFSAHFSVSLWLSRRSSESIDLILTLCRFGTSLFLCFFCLLSLTKVSRRSE